MHVYILFCHPSTTSFCSDILQTFIRGLTDAGHTFELADLYRMGFRAYMDEKQYTQYLIRQLSGTANSPAKGFTLWNNSNKYYMVTRSLTEFTVGENKKNDPVLD